MKADATAADREFAALCGSRMQEAREVTQGNAELSAIRQVEPHVVAVET